MPREEANPKNDALGPFSRDNDAWLAMLAHELRNPLTPMRNALHVLRMRGAEEKTRLWAEQVLERQVNHLSKLIDDLLDISRIQRGKVELQCQPLDLRDIVRSAFEDHRSAFEQAGLKHELFLPSTTVLISADAARLSQSLSALLQNALGYSD